MKLTIENGDLFAVEDAWLCQCISADLGMGAGIALSFNEKLDQKARMTAKYRSLTGIWDLMPEGSQGTAVADREKQVINLITKRNYGSKPSYTTLRNALRKAKVIVEGYGITRLAMPRIGCGLDRLNWEEVEKIIIDVFKDVNVEIIVKSL